MAFIYENGQDSKKNQINSRRTSCANISPLNNMRSYHNSRMEHNKEEEAVKDCLIGLCLIKKGVRVVNQEVYKKYYQ